MIATTARVVSSKDGKVQIDPATGASCAGCKSRESCGVSGLGKYFNHRRQYIEIDCDEEVRAGDELQLSTSEADLLKAGLLAYLLPAVLALLGAGMATSNGWTDGVAVLGAVLGFCAGLLLARWSGWVPKLVANKAVKH